MASSVTKSTVSGIAPAGSDTAICILQTAKHFVDACLDGASILFRPYLAALKSLLPCRLQATAVTCLFRSTLNQNLLVLHATAS